MFDQKTIRAGAGKCNRLGLLVAVSAALLSCFPALVAATEPMLEWLPGEGVVSNTAAGDSRPLITITPTGSDPATQLPFDLGNLNEFRLELGDSGVSLSAQEYVTQSLFGVDSIGAGLLLDGDAAAGGALGWHLGAAQNLGFSAFDSTAPLAGSNFQALAQIQCRDGVVSAQGYLGQDCRLNRSQSRLEAGVNWQPAERVKTRAGVFDQSTAGQAPWSLSSLSPLPGVDSRGLNLDLELGLTTDGFGDWTLGVQVARILDGNITSGFNGNSGAESSYNRYGFQNNFSTASMGLDWQLGDFGGGINSYYRAPIELRGSENLDELTSFDIYFSWQTPWDGSLRIGASNLTEENLAPMPLAPNSESENQIYGRIPYVRYRQDL